MAAPVPPSVPAARAWPAEGLTRVPYWIYQDEEIYRLEQERIFRGATWNFLGLEAELPGAGDFKATFVGELPVVVARDEKGKLNAFENRCAHRGERSGFRIHAARHSRHARRPPASLRQRWS